MKLKLLSLALVLTVGFTIPLGAQGKGTEDEGRKASVTIRKLIASAKLGKDKKALTYIGLVPMSQYLLGKYYKKMKPAQVKKFQALLGEYIEIRAFPLVRKYIGKVGLSYGKPKFKGGAVYIKSSLVAAGSERIVFTWKLKKVGEKYYITDFIKSNGSSSMKVNRDKQIQPTYRKRGPKGLLKLMARINKKIRKH